MRYINLRLTYLLTYLLTYNRKLRRERPTLSEGITNETISALLARPSWRRPSLNGSCFSRDASWWLLYGLRSLTCQCNDKTRYRCGIVSAVWSFSARLTSSGLRLINGVLLKAVRNRPEPSGHRPDAVWTLDQSRVESVSDQHETCYNIVAMRCYFLQFIVV